ncbi:MAG: hypothetical protein ACI83D_000344 [Planctomycetota bacterium]|jgi:hypothetical protein
MENPLKSIAPHEKYRLSVEILTEKFEKDFGVSIPDGLRTKEELMQDVSSRLQDAPTKDEFITEVKRAKELTLDYTSMLYTKNLRELNEIYTTWGQLAGKDQMALEGEARVVVAHENAHANEIDKIGLEAIEKDKEYGLYFLCYGVFFIKETEPIVAAISISGLKPDAGIDDKKEFQESLILTLFAPNIHAGIKKALGEKVHAKEYSTDQDMDEIWKLIEEY